MTSKRKQIEIKRNHNCVFIKTTPLKEEENNHKQIINYYLTSFPNDIKTTTDSNESKDTLNVLNNYSSKNEYLDEIYINLLLDEKKFENKINPEYFSFQKSINYKMRSILIDWIIEIHFYFKFLKKTLFQTVYIIDAYLSKKNIDKKFLQLLGVASLLISCKENEIIYPSLKKLIQLTDNAFSISELKNMEIKIMKTLNFDILSPTAEEFFEINAEFFNFSDEHMCVGEYFLKCSLIGYNMLKYNQSTIAIACGYIIMKCFNLEGTDLILKNCNFDIKEKEIKNCAKELCFLIKDLFKSSLGAVKNIYVNNIITKINEN